MFKFFMTLLISGTVSVLMCSFSINAGPHQSGRIYIAILTVFMSVRSFYYFKYRKKMPVPEKDPDRWERRSLSAGILIAVIVIFYSLPGDIDVPHAMMAAGYFAGVLAVWLIWQAHSDLSLSWSPGSLSHGSGLVTSGIYRYIRHPVYAAFFFLSFSQILLAGNVFFAGILFIQLCSFYFRRIRIEEAHLVQTYGREYEKYRESTPALFPSLFRSGK